MIRRSQHVSIATILAVGCTSLVLGCTSTPSTKQASVSPDPAAIAPPKTIPLQPTGLVTVPTVPGLVPQTNAKARANSVTTGRIDPFSSVQNGPLTLPVAAVTPAKPLIQPAATPGKITLRPSGNAPQSSPGTPSVGTLPLPSLSTTPMPGSLPPVALPALPPPSSTAIADRIAITGLVQIQGQWQIIVKESATGTSRYVKPGAVLAGGQVIVKRIIPGAEPLVVLQQNGKEVTRTVGSSAAV